MGVEGGTRATTGRRNFLVRAVRRVGRRARKRAELRTRQVRASRFYRSGSEDSAVTQAISATRGKSALIVTVAFNRPDLIQWQGALLKKYFRDPYHYLVVDNSSSEESRSAISEACRAMGAGYLPLPPNPMREASQSHGVALNWVHRNVVERSAAGYIGYLDHDIFPIRDVSYRSVCESQGAYGFVQRASDFSFFWPGLFFFSKDFFQSGSADFLPVEISDVYLDTGGGNWGMCHSQLVGGEARFIEHVNVWAAQPAMRFSIQSEEQWALQESAFTIFDHSWIHMVNGSNWAEVNIDKKTLLLREILTTAQSDQAIPEDVLGGRDG